MVGTSALRARSGGIVERGIALALLAVSLAVPSAVHAVTGDGAVWNWGSNVYGQLGDGTTTGHLTPSAMPGSLVFVQVEGGREHVLARTAQGDVYVWGWNRYGQVGSGSTAGSVKSPVKVLSGVTDIGAGHYSSFAVKNDGTLWAWGRNDTGQLGDGSTMNRRTPVQVQGLEGATIAQVSGGRNHTIALADDGTVYAWGNNNYGQLGDGTTLSRLVAEVVPGLAGVVDLFAGRDHCLAVAGDGAVWSWGRNGSGQLGNGKTANRTSPVRVRTVVNGVSVNLSAVVAVGAGADHSLALTSGGAVYAWGANMWGQLGDGTFSVRTRAVPISSLSDIVAVAGGRQSSIALAASGSVFTWGDNRLGQLGNGETGATGRSTPGSVLGVSDATAVGMGLDYGMVLVAP